ncbi:tRNA methyltransferase complex subunit Cpd1 [Crepidotus variabilis]|uniref:tRNA (adenine(58)-N(1))-methyltransferase catalytic subunit TRM61 n=1 Tax=Crepidotus variabilis TaxID=179855 RepID=A0A9P6JLN7_9AGAR|nr:tRNA methyltransferase complex subunit Cpd1 [Crepidotus variabilis]
MWSTAREVAAGDTVIIWLTRDLVQPLVIAPGKDFNTRYGNFKHSDFVGVPYGSKVVPKSGKGFIHILKPTPELWTIALPHRTQILYLADIALITSYLGIRKGSKVIEAGTGSASFSHSVARTVGSAGHLWSYEFHEARFAKAKEEFARHGMEDVVTIQHRNVCKDGFTVVDEVDSVFLDLPAPWDAVEHAKKALRKDCTTRICCFSPCMEQVLRTVSALNEAGFAEITMYETLLRPIEVFQIPQLPDVSVISEKLKHSEAKREEKRIRQIAANKQGKGKRKRDETGEEGAWDAGNEHAFNSKRAKTDKEDQDFIVSMDVMENSSSTVNAVGPSPSNETGNATLVPPPSKINIAKALTEVRGHTSYLTFARLIPIAVAPTESVALREATELEGVKGTITDNSVSTAGTTMSSTIESGS